MANQIIKELDAASIIILAPPNHVSLEQRRSAEEIFLNFQKTKMPYQLCREILETSTMDFVLYESVRVIKSALMREWKLLPSNDINSLKQYLFHYIVNKPTLASFVKEQIIGVIAIIIKRKSIEDNHEDSDNMLNEIESLIINGDLQRQLLGCGLLHALLHEYSGYVNMFMYLTLDVHLNAIHSFENLHLKRIFRFCVGALFEIMKGEITQDRLPFVKYLVKIAESVLVWKFTTEGNSRKSMYLLMLIIGSDLTPALSLDKTWKDIILDPMVVQLFFTLYWKTRSNLEIAHHTRNCLVQLASLNGEVTEFPENWSKYLNEYLSGYIKLVSNIEVIDQEAIGMAQIIRNIVSGGYFGSVSAQMRESFIEQMARLSFVFAEGANLEESLCTEDCLFMEAFEIMLDNWLSLYTGKKYGFPNKFIEQSAEQIFDLYLKCRLSPPDGNRRINDKEFEAEIQDADQNDRTKYKRQLQLIGNIARKAPGHSLAVLSNLLESRATKLQQELSQVPTNPKSNYQGPPINIQNLYEDIHWLVLISGHVLCMESDGETPIIPSEIMRHSMAQKQDGKVDVNMSLQLFISPHSNFSEISANVESFDHVIRLTSIILRLCEIEKMAINGNIGYILSPELSGTIVWFLTRWTLNYLLPDEDNYYAISPTLNHVFGGESIGAQWAVNFLLEKILYSITTFMSEEELIKDVIELLVVLVQSKPTFPDKTLCVLKSDRLAHLIELAVKNHLNLPPVAKRGLMCAIVEIGVALKNENEEEQYWTQTLQLLHDQFNQIISMNFARSPHEEDTKIRIIDALDCFIGIAQGVNISTAQSVFRYVKPVLVQLPHLLSQYHNYQQLVQLILTFLYECSRGMLHYLKQSEKVNVYQSCVCTIEAYARSNLNCVSSDVTEEDNTFQDVLILMTLFCELLTVSKDDISSDGHDQISDVSATDVSFMGLKTIMPIMTMELIKFPTLCQQYFKLISLACELRPKQVCNLENDLLRQLMGSIELGLVSFGDEITDKCCQIIKSMASYVYRKIPPNQPNYQLMLPFMNQLMNLTLTRQIHYDLIFDISTALYYLLFCYQEQYSKLVESFLAAQSNPAVAEKFASAFSDLTAGFKFERSLNLERNECMKFRSNFEKFIISVYELTAIE